MPKPPVPSLEHTFSRYLEYASVIAKNQDQFLQTKENVKDFLRDGGEKFQEKVLELARMTPNWVNHFWLPEMYLKQRYPLPLYSNPAYIFPKKEFKDFENYLTYTTHMIRGLIDFKSLIDHRRAEKDFVDREHSIPMCMNQYDRLLTSYREARVKEDALVRSPVSEDEHVMVMCQKQAFTVAVKVRGQLLSFSEIYHQLARVVEMAKNRNGRNVVPIAGATAGGRDNAAAFWTAAKIGIIIFIIA